VGVDVLTEVVIARPWTEVAAFAGNPGNAPHWYANIKSVRWETPPPCRLGSRMAFTAQFLGRQIAYTYEVTEMEPGKLVMSTAEGPFPMETTYTWEPAGTGSTVMTLRNRGEPGGFGKMAAPVMAGAIRRANQKDLARLKRLMER
jgi:hypothetical protein